MTTSMTVSHRFVQSPLSPYLRMPIRLLTPKKKRGKYSCFLMDIQRFLSIRMINSPITTIAIIMPMPKPVTMVSVIGAGEGVGVGVGSGAACTSTAVSADDA